MECKFVAAHAANAESAYEVCIRRVRSVSTADSAVENIRFAEWTNRDDETRA